MIPPKKSKPSEPVQEKASSGAPGKELLALQQLLLSKEKEIGRLQKHIDKQDFKFENLSKDNDKLREQLKISSSGSEMKQ